MSDLVSLLKYNSEKFDSCLNTFRETFSKPEVDEYKSSVILPLDFSLEMDGISGLIPHSAFEIPTNSLPSDYIVQNGNEKGKSRVAFILHTVDHNFNNNKWTTKITGQVLNIRFEELTEDQIEAIERNKPKQSQINQTLRGQSQTYTSNSCEEDKKIQLSPNYNLADLSCNTSYSKWSIPKQGNIKNYVGENKIIQLTREDITDNLRAIALNILEPIKTKYPDTIVTSGYRNNGNLSQHEKGEAVDIQFTSQNPLSISQQNSLLLSRAKEIEKILNAKNGYDQFLLEYKDTGTKRPWLHISYKTSNNRNIKSTFINNKTLQAGAFTKEPSNFRYT
jgi:hypothetical protein